MDIPEYCEQARVAVDWLERHAPSDAGSEYARQLRVALRALIEAVEHQPSRGAVSGEAWWRVIRPRDGQVSWCDEDPSDRLTAAWEGAAVEGPFVLEQSRPTRAIEVIEALGDEPAESARDAVMWEIVEWLRSAPPITYMAHSTTSGVGLTQRTRKMTVCEAADELERQIKEGTA